MFGEIQEERCYLLGLVAADGNLRKIKSGYDFTLNMIDEDIVCRIRDVLGYGNVTKQKGPLKKKGNGRCKDVYYLRICNKVLGEELIKMGITPRKTHTVKLPTLTDQQKIWWMRGYFDGDGWITKIKDTKDYNVGVGSGSKGVIDLFVETFNMSYSERRWKNKNYKVFYYAQASCKKGLKILDILYKDSRIHLGRKYNLYLDAKRKRGEWLQNKGWIDKT